MKNYDSYVKRMERAVAKKLPVASPLNLGKLPDQLLPYRRSIPTFMHGSKIEFGTIFSPKNYNMSRHVYFPLVMFRPLYSYALDLVIWSRISEKALTNINQCGGFDEYIISVDPKYIECDIATMLRRKITQIYYSDAIIAEKILKQTVERDFYLKNIDKEAIQKENERLSVPPEGKLSSIRNNLYEVAKLIYGDKYVFKLKEAFRQFDSHLSIVARREILQDHILELIKKRKEEWKIELSGEIDLNEFKCKQLKNY